MIIARRTLPLLSGLFALTLILSAQAADEAAMEAAREALYRSHGETIVSKVMVERLEYATNEGDALALWEAKGWVGGDLNKLWFKTEGEYVFDASTLEEAELQALYGRAIRPFWDLQLGLRHDIKPDPSRSYFVAAVHGTAPYWFEVDASLFVSDRGDFSTRLEVEYDLRLTQKLLLQPRVEINAAFSEDEDIGIGSGLSSVQSGLRMRYEFSPQFAPYLGVSWNRPFGETADLAEGEAEASTSFVAGFRMWF